MTAKLRNFEICQACETAKLNPLTALVKSGCRACGIRELARSPVYRSSPYGELNDDYSRALGLLFGDDFRNGHQLVKAERERQRKAAEAAQ